MKTALRLAFIVVGGNSAGYAAFRWAAWAAPRWWAAAGHPLPFGLMLALMAATAIAFAAPPVLIGALAARLAAAHEPFVGLAAALWSISARQWWPRVPLLPAESWIVPMTLILLSGLVGGWLVGRGWQPSVKVPPP
ncbi:MAG: hypothetical protein HY872_17210 [Chloroflexi bacterium]|nr:hypothetical protein [Chloroflexota bacterium]MBI2975649.1 hypothetical protein [Chloroflexota bacterium]MBI3177220.1 hypothetical protein [Chloroflexota bacterium]MBI4316677.1 hypothetical protein [Chloroflexota bacterium]MBI5293617.1 hypothetical protein [Chloroflexota bacterium]